MFQLLRILTYLSLLRLKNKSIINKMYDVIIIGAGISGIGASTVLSKAKISHLILESRDRIGGRICSQSIDGVLVEVGASFIHHSDKKNKIYGLIKDLQWPAKKIESDSEIYLYPGVGELNHKVLKQAEKLYDEIVEQIEEAVKESKSDISIEEASRNYLKKYMPGETPQIRDTVKWMLEIDGNVDGAEMRELSAREFINGKEQGKIDLLPQDGYSKLLHAIYQHAHPQVRLNERVVRIDYSSNIVVVQTDKGVYRAKKVISSLPLGVLQRNIVHFTPELPQSHTQSINKLGNGVANKLIVSFETPFWPKSKTWLNFISSKHNKYPVAIDFSKEDRFILCAFVSADASKQVSKLSDQQIVQDFVAHLQLYFPKAGIHVRDAIVTRWHLDENSLGSYSFYKVGVKAHDIEMLRKPISGKLWMIGQHCHPDLIACAHSAYETGLWAAQEVIDYLNK